MSFFDKLKKSKGGYIFLSHSHDDIVKVREIRNTLENDGFEPLCFYLKCLDDGNSGDEVKDLIVREIDAREWFLFINSENSRKSKWVAFEREHISKTDCKKIITVDINDMKTVEKAIQKIKHNLRIFISYSHKDENIAKRIKNNLVKKDYLVWTDEDMCVGESWLEQASSAIIEASKDGCVIALLTSSSLELPHVKYEILFSVQNGGNVIPVIIGNVKIDGELGLMLGNIQHYRLSEDPTEDEIDEMIERIGQLIVG